jgi:DNA polymerase
MPPFSELSEDIAGLTRRQAVALTHQHFGRDALRLIETIKSASPKRAAVKPPTDSESTRAKAAALRQVRDDLVNATTSPLYQYRIDNRYFPVLGDGNPDANILFIGESPGKTEAETGVPFRGPSGEVLEEMLRTVGLKREDVYVTNLLLDRPPNREPLPAEIEFYAPFVERILDIIQPSVIAPLGRFAATALLKKLDLPEKRSKISELHGKLIKSRMPYGEVHILPLYHPAVVLYSMSQKETLRKDFEKLKLFI